MWPHLRRAGISLVFVIPTIVMSQEPGAGQSRDRTAQGVSPATGSATFYAHSRQVIVEAQVWDRTGKKGDDSWIPEAVPGLPDDGATAIKIFKHMLPPARGLTADSFHVFDNGVEQRINYFAEADFPASGLATSPWVVDPTTRGTWGTLWPNSGIPYAPSATYLIGYVPPAPQPGECRTIQIAVPNRYVQVSRKQYCALNSSDAADRKTLEETKLEARMQTFASSTAPGAIKVSVRASAFWSSGVLSLATRTPPTDAAPMSPATDFTYVVEVHDSKAPATVQIATEFGSPYQLWKYPCHKNAGIHVLGTIYRANGALEGQFSDTWGCEMRGTLADQPIKKDFAAVLIPTLFDTQIELRPGEYQMRVLVTDGKNFGRAQVRLRVQPLDAEALTVSDVVLNNILRDASWIIRDAAKITPYPIVPAPLVSKNVQFLPVADAQLGRQNPLSVYFEIYESLLEASKVDVSYSLKIIDLKTGTLVMNTGPMSAADWVVPGNAVIPIGLKLAIEKLPAGSYKLEIQATDSMGRQTEWRQADFMIK